jgi:hypothetical protein
VLALIRAVAFTGRFRAFVDLVVRECVAADAPAAVYGMEDVDRHDQ